MLVDFWVLLGVVNALLLAVAAAVASRHDRRWAWLCTLLALLAAVVTAILVTHRTEGAIERAAVAVEQLSWITGPVLYHYVRQSLGYPVTAGRAWVHFALPLLVLLIGTPAILIWRVEPLAPAMLIAQQVAYTAASVSLFVRRPEPADRSPLGFWWPSAALATAIGIHIGQALRLSRFSAEFQDVVPIIGAGSAIALILLALVLPQAATTKVGRYAKSSIGAARSNAIFAEAVETLKREELYRRHDLMLGDLAARCNVSAHHLSQALTVSGQTSFAELVSQLRVDDAIGRLLEPGNREVAVEPIGMEAGFRSRSAFYAAFRERTGLSPAEFRRQRATFVSSPTGQDMDRLD